MINTSKNIEIMQRVLMTGIPVEGLSAEKDTVGFMAIKEAVINNSAFWRLIEEIYIEGGGLMAKANISTLSDGRYMVQIRLGVDENGKSVRKNKSFRSEDEAIAQKAEWDKEYATAASLNASSHHYREKLTLFGRLSCVL